MTKLVMAFLFGVLITACSGEKKANELLETAQFEEKQHNLEHARKLYQDILKNYPSSKAAKTSASRLEQLSKQ